MTLNGNLTQESALEKHFLSVQVSELFFYLGISFPAMEWFQV